LFLDDVEKSLPPLLIFKVRDKKRQDFSPMLVPIRRRRCFFSFLAQEVIRSWVLNFFWRKRPSFPSWVWER